MDRYTAKVGNSPAVPTKFDLDFAFALDDATWKGLDATIQQLAAYEKTNLIPEQIEAMQGHNTALTAEVERLTAEVECLDKEYHHYRRLSEEADQQIATLKKALSDMLFAYQNKDSNFPHQFEIKAVRKAKKTLERAFEQAQEQEGHDGRFRA